MATIGFPIPPEFTALLGRLCIDPLSDRAHYCWEAFQLGLSLREEENRVESPKITFIVSAWGRRRPLCLRTMLSSLIVQTEPRWEAIVIDMEHVDAHESYCRMDSRISYSHGEHKTIYHASEYAATLASGDWLAFPSDDGYYCPYFATKMIEKGEVDNLDLVLCDLMYGGALPGEKQRYWKLDTHPQKCSIDKTSFVVRRSKMIPFSAKDYDVQQSDGIFAEELIASGAKWGKVAEILACHN